MYPAADFRLLGGVRPRRAFTLIELLTVISIILILAGLVLHLAGSAQTRAAQSRATAEIQAISTAAGNYQIDNGTYPRVPNKSSTGATVTPNTDDLYAYYSGNPPVCSDPTSTTSPTYSSSSLILYQFLSGYYIPDPASSGKPKLLTTPGTIYYPFKNSQLKGAPATGNVTPSNVTALVDPFGFSYGYSTAYQADVDAINAGTMTAPVKHGFNPTFDLWSTAGYASSGKTYPSTVTAANYNTLWTKNW